MLTPEQNAQLTQVGPGTPMGQLLRHYWMPIAGVSEFEDCATKPIRLLGEDLVLYKDLSGNFGLLDQQCPHRRANLSLMGVVESTGLRCHYHGWKFNSSGDCIQQPFEDTAWPEKNIKQHINTKSYPVELKGGLVWAYLGPQPAPLLPDWEAFSWPNGFAQIVISKIPCNWFQCQENSIDPVHFEWTHENWPDHLNNNKHDRDSTHLKLDFKEFEFGFTYHRLRKNNHADDENWIQGRVCLWPNGFFLGEHFEWRVPIDDENTLSVVWKYIRVPKEKEPYVQKLIPTWHGPVKDSQGNWINTGLTNQDFVAWIGQGVIADRSLEKLSASDQGIVIMRRRFFEELAAMKEGKELRGIIRDPEKNIQIHLPSAGTGQAQQSLTLEQIAKISPWVSIHYLSFIYQAGQPDWVKKLTVDALGVNPIDYRDLQNMFGKFDYESVFRSQVVKNTTP
jgi:5,5'-dehydrodivanillate O-demethylase